MKLRESEPAEKVALLLFDEESIYPESFKPNPDTPIKIEILKYHAEFLKNQVKKLSQGGYTKVIIANFGAIQSYYGDKIHQTQGSPSCLPILPILQGYFQENLVGCEVVLDPITTRDIYANQTDGGVRPAGKSYLLSLREQYGHSEEKESESKRSNWGFIGDTSRVSLLYMYAHRVADLHPNAKEIHIAVFNNNPSPLIDISDFYSENTMLLPKNCEVELFEYSDT